MIGTKKIVVVADTHCPFHDLRAVEMACKIITEFNPDTGIHLGDGVDFYAASTFDKCPARTLKLQAELDAVQAVNEMFDSASKAKWTYLKGNHEVRWERFMHKHPELYSLEGLTLSSLLGLPEIGWEFADEKQVGPILFTHGKRISKHPGRAVMAELGDRLYQVNVVIGHGHRTGNYIVRGHNTVVQGFEVGCLCDLKPEYRPVNNWTQGMLLLTLSGKRFGAEQLVFENRRCWWRGREYKV